MWTTFRHLYFLVRTFPVIATTNGNISRLEQSVNNNCLCTQQLHNTRCPPRPCSLCSFSFKEIWKTWGHLWWGECASKAALTSAPPKPAPRPSWCPAGESGAAGLSQAQGAEKAPAPEAGLVSLIGSAHPQQVPSPWLHPQTCPRTRPEHHLTRAWLVNSGWVHPLAPPQGAHRATPSGVGSAGSPSAQEDRCGSPKRDINTCYFTLLEKSFHRRPGQGSVRGEATDTSKLMIQLLPFCLPWWYRTLSDDLT